MLDYKKYIQIVIFIITISFFSCKKDITDYITEISTKEATSISYFSVNTGGIIKGNKTDGVFERGVCYSETPNPNVNSPSVFYSDISENYDVTIYHLIPNQKYFARAFARIENSIIYGQEITFTTLATELPIVSTDSIVEITGSTAVCYGTLIFNGGLNIHNLGFCYGSTPYPTVNDNIAAWCLVDSVFTTQIDFLQPHTTYYVRAFATNELGIAYGNQLHFETKDFCGNASHVSDSDNNLYNIIPIHNQCWMQENLKTTRLNDGTPIPLVENNISWSNLMDPGFSWYNNDNTSYGHTYGALYNWYAVKTEKLCPLGWRVPTDEDWHKLNHNFGGPSEAGYKLKDIGTMYWSSPNTLATNESGFTALPGGERNYFGLYDRIGYAGNWWTTTEVDNFTAIVWNLRYNAGNTFRESASKRNGYSVRCIKN